MNYYPHHIGDFRSGTFNMTRQERWVYRDMIDVYYDTEGPFPDDLDAIYKMMGIRRDEDKELVAAILLLKFELRPSGYHHVRCDMEIAAYKAKAETAKNNGKKGGRPAKNNQEKPSWLSVGSDQVISGIQSVTGSKANQEPRTKNQELNKIKSTVPPSGETATVFAYWQQAMNHPQAKLDAKRDRAIKARLKDGYTVDQLCKAVDGCKLSPHHMGKNDTSTVYDDIELICRDGPKVDKFIGWVERGPVLQSQLGEHGQATANAALQWLDSQ